jgi:predicted RND superfamily exporter protein
MKPITETESRSRRRNKGFIWTAAGAFLGFASCVLTIINPVPALYDLLLYGVTSLAILMIFVGLYLVFE